MDRKYLRQQIIESLKPDLRYEQPQRLKITFSKRTQFNNELPQRSASVKFCKKPKLQIYSSPNTTYKTDSLDKFKANLQTWKQIQNPKVLNLGNRKQKSLNLLTKKQIKSNNLFIGFTENPQVETSQVKRYQDSSAFKRQQEKQIKTLQSSKDLQDCLKLVQQMSSQIKNLRTTMQQSLQKSRSVSQTDFYIKDQFTTPVKINKISQQQLINKHQSTSQTKYSYKTNLQNQQEKNESQKASHGSQLNHVETSSRIIYQTPKKFFAQK